MVRTKCKRDAPPLAVVPRPTPLPPSAYLLYYLRILSPRAWVGVLRFVRATAVLDDNDDVVTPSAIGFSSSLVSALVAALVPALALALVSALAAASTPISSVSTSGPSVLGPAAAATLPSLLTDILRRVAPPCLASPLVLGYAFGGGASRYRRRISAATSIASRFAFLVKARKTATDDAISALSDGVDSGRVLRRGRYDLYLPPAHPYPPPYVNMVGKRAGVRSHKKPRSRRVPMPGLVLIPGMLVPTSSYASVASRLSDTGVAVAVLSLEPWRLARSETGAGVNDVIRVMKDAGRDVARWRRRGRRQTPAGGGESAAVMADGDGGGKLEVEKEEEEIGVEWSLGGHSMGGYAALSVASQWQGGRDSGSRGRARRLVIWAAGSRPDLIPDLSQSPFREIFLLFASGDVYCPPLTGRSTALPQSKLPQGGRVLCDVVRGGNHDGFASYPTTPQYDGVRRISRDRQHNLVSQKTGFFLLRE